ILSNGYLESVRIIRSSGSSLLDNAALQTVKQASPYQPFSLAMRKAYDRLEFTRTWQYSRFGTNINY
ncbi:MAG: TonB family protein, partial [Pseudomonadota bacterium]|nr:TonB family protein [Pseudomonadota bacterium]